MKASAVQHAFKSLASRIHPQLPLSERESQRLLSALTSSFRNHLDHDASAPPQHQASSTTATDRHLASILTNPLLTKPLHAQLKSSSKHPIALFEDQVAAGRANLNSARLCLEAFRNSLDSLSPTQADHHIRRYAAGTRALRWLWTTASTPSLSFALDSRFCSQLAFFLIREGRENVLWELIESPVPTSANLSSREASRRKGLLLTSIIKTLLAVPNDALSSAVAAFFRALDASSTSHASISHAGAYLSQTLVKLNLPTASDVALYDRFVESVPRWNKKHPDRAIYRVANLKLHHPTAPSADAALGFIRDLKPLASHPFLSPATSSQRSTVFAFFFDTVKILQKEGRYDDALWVMEFMQLKFPADFTSTSGISSEALSPSPFVAEASDAAPSSTDLPDWRVPGFG